MSSIMDLCANLNCFLSVDSPDAGGGTRFTEQSSVYSAPAIFVLTFANASLIDRRHLSCYLRICFVGNWQGTRCRGLAEQLLACVSERSAVHACVHVAVECQVPGLAFLAFPALFLALKSVENELVKKSALHVSSDIRVKC